MAEKIKKQEKERWGVELVLVSETEPPQKFVVDRVEEDESKRHYDVMAALVKCLNNQEKLLQLLD